MSGRLSQQPSEHPSIEQIRAEFERRYYFEPIREGLQAAVRSYGHIEALNHLTTIMRDASPALETIIQQRMAQGLIRDAPQARKSIAGNGFQGLVAYSLLLLQDAGMVPSTLAITLKPKHHPLIEQYRTIRVGDDVQKPDIDLFICHREQPLQFPLLIYSMKTSLRARAGQTYRWKLLVDIASSDTCSAIKERQSKKSTTSIILSNAIFVWVS